jgi:hypothetical protein
MSELQNPIFDEEKEFLERKKLEYERALRGDVDHIKEQSVKVGKVALVGAGLAGSVWLITKVFGGKKKRKHASDYDASDYYEADYDQFLAEQAEAASAEYFTSGSGKRYKSTIPGRKSAAESAQVFAAHDEQSHEGDDLGFGSTAAPPMTEVAPLHGHGLGYEQDQYFGDETFNNEAFEEDPFQDLPYDDSRRLPVSHAFDGSSETVASTSNSRSKMIGSVLQSFLKSDTGKILVAQAAAVALAMVTKKLNEFFPAAKNPDLAASPEVAVAATEETPVALSATSVLSDASNPSQSL